MFKCLLIGKDLHTSPLCGYKVQPRRPTRNLRWLGWVARDCQESLSCQHDLIMIIYIYIYIYILIMSFVISIKYDRVYISKLVSCWLFVNDARQLSVSCRYVRKVTCSDRCQVALILCLRYLYLYLHTSYLSNSNTDNNNLLFPLSFDTHQHRK